jgi:hypothetical protein
MLHVAVYSDDIAGHHVRWNEVVGVLCAAETEYLHGVTEGADTPNPGATHDEMIDRGWKSNQPLSWFPAMWPVLAAGYDTDESPLYVFDERHAPSNLTYSTILICTWPVEEDRDRAIAAGRELIRAQGESKNWAFIAPVPDLAEQEAR